MNFAADGDDRRSDDTTDDRPLVALTGATGFLGSHIADRMILDGFRVRAAARPSSDLRWLRGKPIEIQFVDLGAADAVRRLVTGARWVVHCAGVMTAPDEATYRRINVDTTRTLLEVAADEGAAEAFLLISSLAASGPGSLAEPRREEQGCRPVSAYGRSKLSAEALMRERTWPFRTVALRPPALYGPRDQEFMPLLRAARAGWTARFGTALSGLSMVHGADAASAVAALLAEPSAEGAYFVDDAPDSIGPDSIGPDSIGPDSAPPVSTSIDDAPAAADDSLLDIHHRHARQHAWGYDFDEIRAALQHVMDRRIRRLNVPLGPLRLASRLLGHGPLARSPLLNPDRLADLSAPGWVCSGERLLRKTRFRPRHDLFTGLRDTVDACLSLGWLR